MRDFFRSPLFRCLVCLILVCCILVNVSPIRAEALPISMWVWLEASMVFASIMAGLGVSPIDELAEGFADTCNSCWDFVSLNYDFVTDDEKIAVWATGTDDLPFMVDQEVIEAVRDWLFSSETIIEDDAASGMAYYNNWYLPVLPVSSSYQFSLNYQYHAIILTGTTFILTSSTVPMTCDLSSQYATVGYSASGHIESFTYKESYSDWQYGSYSKVDQSGLTSYSDGFLVWSNVDLYNRSDELILAASVPSDTVVISSDDEKYLLNYVAPSEMDFSTGYSTWTAGAISVPGVRAEEGEETVVVPLSIPGTAADVYSFSQADVWTGANTAADVIAQAVPITGTGTADPTLPVVPDVPTEIAPYTFSLNDIFPFCIPFDLYDFLTCLDAAPVAPVIEWALQLPGGGTFPITLDLSPFDSVAQLLRRLELLIFCVGLALKTRDLIKG